MSLQHKLKSVKHVPTESKEPLQKQTVEQKKIMKKEPVEKPIVKRSVEHVKKRSAIQENVTQGSTTQGNTTRENDVQKTISIEKSTIKTESVQHKVMNNPIVKKSEMKRTGKRKINPRKTTPIKNSSIKTTSSTNPSIKRPVIVKEKPNRHKELVKTVLTDDGDIVLFNLLVSKEGELYIKTMDDNVTITINTDTPEHSEVIIGTLDDFILIDRECSIYGIAYEKDGLTMYYDFGVKNETTGITFETVSFPGFLTIECGYVDGDDGTTDFTDGNVKIGKGLSISKHSHFYCNTLSLYKTTE